MKIIAALLSLLCLASCDYLQSEQGTYSGYYAYGFETSYFLPEGKKEKWWLQGTAPCPEIQAKSPPMGPSPILFVVVRGKLSGKGSHGHMGAYSRELTATEVVSCRIIRSNEHPAFEF
jgi:hypothetical protein